MSNKIDRNLCRPFRNFNGKAETRGYFICPEDWGILAKDLSNGIGRMFIIEKDFVTPPQPKYLDSVTARLK